MIQNIFLGLKKCLIVFPGGAEMIEHGYVSVC